MPTDFPYVKYTVLGSTIKRYVCMRHTGSAQCMLVRIIINIHHEDFTAFWPALLTGYYRQTILMSLHWVRREP